MKHLCSKCKNPAVTFIRYNGTHLCQDHFTQYFEKRVKKEINKQGKLENNTKIGIAVSGGKDSIVTLHIMKKIFLNRKNVKIIALTVDEGIKDYRDNSIKYVIENCKKLHIDYNIISFKNSIGKTMDDISELKNDIGFCSYCGVFRRVCLNNLSKKLKISKLVMGHNLDDMSQSIMMNFVNGDIKKFAKLGPHKKIQPGLVPRMIPLRLIPEKEINLYAILKKISYHNGECPYSINAYRSIFRDIIDNLEYKNPGTRHSILKSYDTIKDMLIQNYPLTELNRCIKCFEPTSQDICKSCLLKLKIKSY
jgi:uncharacterized protein (TIGR00269 family)